MVHSYKSWTLSLMFECRFMSTSITFLEFRNLTGVARPVLICFDSWLVAQHLDCGLSPRYHWYRLQYVILWSLCPLDRIYASYHVRQLLKAVLPNVNCKISVHQFHKLDVSCAIISGKCTLIIQNMKYWYSNLLLKSFFLFLRSRFLICYQEDPFTDYIIDFAKNILGL